LSAVAAAKAELHRGHTTRPDPSGELHRERHKGAKAQRHNGAMVWKGRMGEWENGRKGNQWLGELRVTP